MNPSTKALLKESFVFALGVAVIFSMIWLTRPEPRLDEIVSTELHEIKPSAGV
jgi:hypothetical protein